MPEGAAVITPRPQAAKDALLDEEYAQAARVFHRTTHPSVPPDQRCSACESWSRIALDASGVAERLAGVEIRLAEAEAALEELGDSLTRDNDAVDDAYRRWLPLLERIRRSRSLPARVPPHDPDHPGGSL